VDVIRDRANTLREGDDPVVENIYRLQIMNTDETPRDFAISVSGLEAMKLVSEPQPIHLAGASNRMVPVRVRVEREHAAKGSNRIEFTIQATEAGSAGGAQPLVIRERASFVVQTEAQRHD
jgi:polyferredoxin